MYRLVLKSLAGDAELRVEESADFAAMLLAYRTNNDVNASEWIGCKVYAENGEVIARLAYNGQRIE